MPRTSESKRGRISAIGILIIVVVGFAGYYIFTHPPKPKMTDNKLEEENQQTADGAMDFYLRSAYRYLHNESEGQLTELQTAMPKEEWDWFEANYATIFKEGDMLKVGDVLGADQNVALSRFVVLKSLLHAAPCQTDVEKLNRDESNPGSVVYTLRQPDGLGGFEDFTVEVVNTGKYWKVKAFECARKNMGLMQQPAGEDIPESGPDESAGAPLNQ